MLHGVWKLSKVNDCRTETVHFWPYVGKAKMHLRDSRFFSIFKNLFIIFSCLFLMLQKFYCLSNTWWPYQHRIKKALTQFTAIYFWQFSIGTPCKSTITLHFKVSIEKEFQRMAYFLNYFAAMVDTIMVVYYLEMIHFICDIFENFKPHLLLLFCP